MTPLNLKMLGCYFLSDWQQLLQSIDHFFPCYGETGAFSSLFSFFQIQQLPE
uniref:Uncharacterized protein n=1 Tax=Arundo donax TaxID=35708 RepID=A0A0A9J404_ARUDO